MAKGQSHGSEKQQGVSPYDKEQHTTTPPNLSSFPSSENKALFLSPFHFSVLLFTLSSALYSTLRQMEDYNNLKRVQIPAFGNWDYCNEMPITQYFESAMQAGLIRGHLFAEDADLFKVPVAPTLKPATYHYSHHHHNSHRKGGKSGGEKQGRVYDMTTQSQSPRKPSKVPKAVDEDLYKIPPELLYQKSKRKRLMLKNLWSGCLGLNSSCVA